MKNNSDGLDITQCRYHALFVLIDNSSGLVSAGNGIVERSTQYELASLVESKENP